MQAARVVVTGTPEDVARCSAHTGRFLKAHLRAQRSLVPQGVGFDIVYTIEYSCTVEFEWDDQKNRSNSKKHGIWFEEAQTVWVDSKSLEFFDPEHSADENRFIRIGHSAKNRILLVVFCERADASMVRILSARKATPREVKDYEKGI
jgi:uncharacterized DUF497 family protein